MNTIFDYQFPDRNGQTVQLWAVCHTKRVVFFTFTSESHLFPQRVDLPEVA